MNYRCLARWLPPRPKPSKRALRHWRLHSPRLHGSRSSSPPKFRSHSTRTVTHKNIGAASFGVTLPPQSAAFDWLQNNFLLFGSHLSSLLAFNKASADYWSRIRPPHNASKPSHEPSRVEISAEPISTFTQSLAESQFWRNQPVRPFQLLPGCESRP